jgi:hypothetical protein
MSLKTFLYLMCTHSVMWQGGSGEWNVIFSVHVVKPINDEVALSVKK